MKQAKPFCCSPSGCTSNRWARPRRAIPAAKAIITNRNSSVIKSRIFSLSRKLSKRTADRMTIQAQSPFTSVAIESGNTLLVDLAARGHELALHFHEDAHLGKNDGALPIQQWCDGNLYPNIFEAAQCAGLDVNSDWKNPKLQETPLELTGVNPWRTAERFIPTRVGKTLEWLIENST